MTENWVLCLPLLRAQILRNNMKKRRKKQIRNSPGKQDQKMRSFEEWWPDSKQIGSASRSNSRSAWHLRAWCIRTGGAPGQAWVGGAKEEAGWLPPPLGWEPGAALLLFIQTPKQCKRALRPERWDSASWGRGSPPTTLSEVTLSSSRSLPLPHDRQTAAIRPDNHHNQTRICEHKCEWITNNQQLGGKPTLRKRTTKLKS